MLSLTVGGFKLSNYLAEMHISLPLEFDFIVKEKSETSRKISTVRGPHATVSICWTSTRKGRDEWIGSRKGNGNFNGMSWGCGKINGIVRGNEINGYPLSKCGLLKIMGKLPKIHLISKAGPSIDTLLLWVGTVRTYRAFSRLWLQRDLHAGLIWKDGRTS